MKQIVHVAQCDIRANAKDGGLRPPIILRDYKGAVRAHELELIDRATGRNLGRFVYSPHSPLRCGARLWLELDSNVVEARPCQ